MTILGPSPLAPVRLKTYQHRPLGPRKERKTLMAKTMNKHIRVDEDHWQRIEDAANARGISPSRFIIKAALQDIEDREWPRTELELRVARSCLFTAQVLARDLIAAGREEELEEIRRHVSQLAPELPAKAVEPAPPATQSPDDPDGKV